jgi:hypothetical protein
MNWGHPDQGCKQMKEAPKYADINDAELREIEAEFGRPLTRELALWSIRNRTNREAVERMLADNDANQVHINRGVREIPQSKARKPTSTRKKRCA